MRMRRVVGMVVATLLAGIALAGCADPSERFTDPGQAELVRAAAAGDVQRVRELQAAGVDIEARGRHGYTPLLAMVEARRERGVATLLAAGADRGAASDNGFTAVHVAAAQQQPRMLEVLLDLGFDPSSPNAVTGGSPLRPAFWGRNEDTAKLLVARGTDVSLADRTGHTPLHYAASINYTWAVKLLLDSGADPLARTVTGTSFQQYLFQTPERVLLESVKKDRRDIEAWLTERGIPIEKD